MRSLEDEEFCIDPGCYAIMGPKAHFHAIHGLALVTLFLSAVASIFIIYRAVFCMKRYKTAAQRFPIYLSVLDLGWSFFSGLDHLLIISTQHFPPAPGVRILGACIHIFLMAPASLVSVTCFSVYCNMFHRWRISFGRFDWHLISLCVGVPVIMAIVGLAVGDVFGPAGYWVYLFGGSERLTLISWVYAFVPLFVTFFGTCWSCFFVSRKIRRDSMAFSEGNALSKGDAQIMRAANRILLFGLIFLAQWLPMVVLTIAMATRRVHWTLTLGKVGLTNLGGLLNAIAFQYQFPMGEGNKHNSPRGGSNKGWENTTRKVYPQAAAGEATKGPAPPPMSIEA